VSMDEVMQALRSFERQLDGLTATMQGSVKALEREHQKVSGLWQDSFSRDYHRRWGEFDRHMKTYLQKDAPKYKAFLSTKIRQLRAYLHG
jgi:uncharacterized protein YukE